MVCETTISKITTAKWTGSMAQAVECLVCKCKALNSNSNPTKKRKKENLSTEHIALDRAM
jgi:hypothetical protein